MHSLIEEIYSENSWRDGEFARFKSNQYQVDPTLWARMCIPMIYANWEGFVVNALKLMIKHLNKLNLTPTQIPTRLVVFGLGNTYRSLSGKQNFEQRCAFTDRFSRILSETVRFETNIETKSNLNSDVLAELCQIFGFDINRFKDLKSNINMIVRIRNSIAHGENAFTPSQENIEEYIHTVQKAIDILMDEINCFISEQKYLMASQSPA